VTTDYGRLAAMYTRVHAAATGSAYFLDTTTKAMLMTSQENVATAAIYESVVHAYFETFPGYRMPSSRLGAWGEHAVISGLTTKATFDRYGTTSLSADEWPQSGSGVFTTFALEPMSLSPMFNDYNNSRPTPMSNALLTTITGSVDSGDLGVYRPYVLSRWATQHAPCDLTALRSGESASDAFSSPYGCYR
jgi:hypothetical protein